MFLGLVVIVQAAANPLLQQRLKEKISNFNLLPNSFVIRLSLIFYNESVSPWPACRIFQGYKNYLIMKPEQIIIITHEKKSK